MQVQRWSAAGAVLAVAMTSVVIAAPAAKTCRGERATIVGTDEAEDLIGTSGDDVIVAGDGDDLVDARAGNDIVCGRGGFDLVLGGGGADLLDGGDGDDNMRGGKGDDVLLGRTDADSLAGGEGNDDLSGGPNEEPLLEDLIGGPGDDTMTGGPGLDRALYFDSMQPVEVDLGAGTATGDGTDTLVTVEGATGSNFDDLLVGTDASNGLVGLEGDDVIRALGSGTLEEGSDLLLGGGGDDTLEGGDGYDFASYDFGCVPVDLDLGAGTATGQGADTLTDIEGGFGSDCDDVLVGDDGDNAFLGREGDDTLDGAGGTDTAIFLLSPGPIVANLGSGTSSGPGAGSDGLQNIEDLWGSSLGDLLTGDDGNNRIFGLVGNDSLFGKAGDDVLDGGDDTDRLDGDEGSDTCTGEFTLGCEFHPEAPGRLLFPWSVPVR